MSLPDFEDLERPFLEKCGTLITEKILIHPDSKLHEDQQEALKSIIDWFGNSEKKGLTAVVVMPTGTGKTGVICCLPYMLGWAVEKQKIEHDLTKPILVLAPGLTILKQLEENICYDVDNTEPFLLKRQLLTQKQHKFIYSTLVVDNTDAVKNLYTTESRKQVVLSNVQKWRKKKDVPNYEELSPDLFSAVVVDEAHHLPAEQWKKIIHKFEPAKVIFFTATPYRSDGKEITSDRAISKTKDFTFFLRRNEAIKKRLIREIDFDDHIECEDSTERHLTKQCMTKVLKEIKSKLAEKNTVSRLPGGTRHSAIVITRSIDEAEDVKSICVETLKWTNVKVIHSGCSREAKEYTEENNQKMCSGASNRKTKAEGKIIKDRMELIKEIHSNKYELLIVVAMLLEGFDHPPLSVAGILTNIQSQVKFAQFVGRIQRLVRTPDIETGIVGNIITVKNLNQRRLYEQYTKPTLADELEIDDEE